MNCDPLTLQLYTFFLRLLAIKNLSDAATHQLYLLSQSHEVNLKRHSCLNSPLHFTSTGAIVPKISERCRSLTCVCLRNLV